MSQLINVKEQSEKQAIKLIQTILKTRKGFEYDGFEAQKFFLFEYGIYADHHVFTSVMENMTRYGLATTTQGWGNTRYLIN